MCMQPINVKNNVQVLIVIDNNSNSIVRRSLRLFEKKSLSDIVGLATTSNFIFELVKSVKICSTSNNSKLFATEEKTNDLVLEIKRSRI